jgi:hypothetical protein
MYIFSLQSLAAQGPRKSVPIQGMTATHAPPRERPCRGRDCADRLQAKCAWTWCVRHQIRFASDSWQKCRHLVLGLLAHRCLSLLRHVRRVCGTRWLELTNIYLIGCPFTKKDIGPFSLSETADNFSLAGVREIKMLQLGAVLHRLSSIPATSDFEPLLLHPVPLRVVSSLLHTDVSVLHVIVELLMTQFVGHRRAPSIVSWRSW